VAVTSESSRPQPLYTANPGRPKMNIDMEKVKILRSVGFSWKEICKKTGVSLTTIKQT